LPPRRSGRGRFVVYPPSLEASAYPALVSTPSSSVSTETPVQVVSSFDHLVTQWMSTVTVSVGRVRNSSQLHERSRSTAPLIVKLQAPSEWYGVGPAESTGKSSVRYWPGGTRAGSASTRCFLWNPRVNGVTLPIVVSRVPASIGRTPYRV